MVPINPKVTVVPEVNLEQGGQDTPTARRMEESSQTILDVEPDSSTDSRQVDNVELQLHDQNLSGEFEEAAKDVQEKGADKDDDDGLMPGIVDCAPDDGDESEHTHTAMATYKVRTGTCLPVA
jgi:hypothetical protein